MSSKAATSLIIACILCMFPSFQASAQSEADMKAQPKIVNIVNFIRQVEPRSETGLEKELYQTVEEQIAIMKKYGLKGTFLLQYDALINPLYQNLLRTAPEGSEIGGWWEITQPHVEAAGLKWRGRYPWDWHANVGFATGYTPEEREILVDVYMEKFKEIFGSYPKSVGSWFIDAHTLEYMYEKYGIVASCNCKDQYGTDGYTMWGGYWNQAYYPSKSNAYMPAQTEEGQIPVPIFRMLGSDPVYQYDLGIGSTCQGVVTLEPVYTGTTGGGAVPQWVSWYLNMISSGESLQFNYLQAGQENSFTWERMKAGYLLQMPLIRKMADEGKFTIETLSETGEWFKSRFTLTPATSVVADDDFLHTGRATIWYDSRFYRANLYWNGKSFRFRDIHLFDERLESDYLRKAGTSTKCDFVTLPVVDGYLWSTSDCLAGLRLIRSDGSEVAVQKPAVEKRGESILSVRAETELGELRILLEEGRISICVKGCRKGWALELTKAEGSLEAPSFGETGRKHIPAKQKDFDYSIDLLQGKFIEADGALWRAVPGNSGKVVFDTARGMK